MVRRVSKIDSQSFEELQRQDFDTLRTLAPDVSPIGFASSLHGFLSIHRLRSIPSPVSSYFTLPFTPTRFSPAFLGILYSTEEPLSDWFPHLDSCGYPQRKLAKMGLDNDTRGWIMTCVSGIGKNTRLEIPMSGVLTLIELQPASLGPV